MMNNVFIKQRIVFMGSPEFAVPSLNALIESGHDIVAVYTQAPKAKNRGHHVQKTPIHLLAEQFEIPVYTPTSLKTEEAQNIFSSHKADIGFVAAYGLILPKQILNSPRLGCINIHASLLPRWRGAAPIHRAILANDNESGITLMQMDEGLDTGDMLAKVTVNMPPDITTPILHDQLSHAGAKLLADNLPDIFDGALRPVAQDDTDVTYAHKLTKEESRVSFLDSAQSIETKVRALNPWPGVYFNFAEIPIKIHQSTIINLAETSSNTPQAGTFFQTKDHALCVACGNNSYLSLQYLQRPGGKPLASEDFLAGFEQLRHARVQKI